MKWRKNTRLKDYNYKTDGYYFITVCTALKKPLLAQYRKEAETTLQNLPSRFSGVKLDFYSFMPDHLHAIFVLNDTNASIGQIIRTYKALVTKTTGHKPFWEWNYYEHIIRNERALYEIRKYIQENPEKERFDLKAIYRRINATATNDSNRSTQNCSGLIYQTQTPTPLAKAIVDAYARGEEDEALEPLVLVDKNNQPVGRIKNGDYIIFYDLRGEREIELTRAFTEKDFREFSFPKNLQVNFVTLVEYSKGLNVRVAFPPEEELKDTLSEVISTNGLRQVKICESEKMAHINYFFNGKRKEPFANEERIVIPSPKNIAYDQAPEMSIAGVTAAINKKLQDPNCAVIIANFANIDVVGHIENETAIKKAVAAVDKNVGLVVDAAQKADVTTLVTADHGTAEKWLYPDGTIDTGHTDSPVPFIVASSEELGVRENGELADVAPTVLEILGIPKPDLMTAHSLLENTRINADSPRCEALDTDKSGKKKNRRILLLILDGWGINDETKGNLIKQAKTPVMDRLEREHPFARLQAAGEPVGLPEKVVGNSEVGHLHIGAGRRVYSDRLRIDRAIADGSFFKNEVLTGTMDRARQAHAALHLLGIVSFYSSHGSLEHLKALMSTAKTRSVNDIFIHAIIGRRGEKPESGARYLAEIERMGIGRVVSVIGRFWALDREDNWNRVEKTYRLLVRGSGRPVGF